MKTRTEHDSMGMMQVPGDAWYGASTQRAVLNFPVSGRTLPARFIHAVGLLKVASASANEELGRLAAGKARLIKRAAREVASGELDREFPVDVFQTGSATSTNMNANEVIANRANHRARRVRFIHPNDDVNLGQSSNDIMPSALHVSVALALQDRLLPALKRLERELLKRARAFSRIVKLGRTHLMDATPITLGQEFSGYAGQIEKSAARTRHAIACLMELAVGGTAVGTGLNTHRDFARKVCRFIRSETGLPFREARNHFEAQAARDDSVEVAGQLFAISSSLLKVASDVRLMGSGPRGGIAELRLPPVQPGSSIMPGKVNPVMCEMLIQACHYAQGLGFTVVRCGGDGYFELNTTIPLIAHCLHEAIAVLAAATDSFTRRCIEGLEADADRCRELVERSLMLVTALAPHIGYEKAASVAHEAHGSGRTLREIVLKRKLLDARILDRALDPGRMTRRDA